MSPQRQADLLQGNSAIARKVYAAVPASEPWDIRQINIELRRQNVCVDYRVVDGCLAALIETGLVREADKRMYIRTPVREKPVDKTPHPVAPEPKKEDAALDMLAALAIKARALADDIDAAALRINAMIEAGDEELHKLQQLKSILKSIA